MGRTACVDLPALPLQLLLRRHAEWRDHPVAVVDDDRPGGKILWVNERARTARILPGMRYAAGLSLSGKLRAAVVPPGEIARAVAALGRRLRDFTPHVEPAEDDPGAFWLDASGLERLHDSLRSWAGEIRSALERSGFRATVVVGFDRFGTHALARARRGVLVLDSPADERAAARCVPLDRLGPCIDPATRDLLDKLGVRTVGAFVDLPPRGIERRLGPAALRLYRLASGALEVPLQPEKPPAPAIERTLLDHPETSVPRLMVVIERAIGPLLHTLAGRVEALGKLLVGFRFERAGRGDHIETLCPAVPTLDAAQLLELVRLRLEAVRKLPDAVTEIVLAAEGVPATREQMQLFAERPRRDLAAANRALARIRADLGDGSVTRARMREGHLPEARFTWETTDSIATPRPGGVDGGGLVRRIYARPVPLPPRSRHEPDGWLLRGLKHGHVVNMLGPYVVAGGWWRRAVHREYHFAETRHGELLWIFYDRARRRWYLHGRVE